MPEPSRKKHDITALTIGELEQAASPRRSEADITDFPSCQGQAAAYRCSCGYGTRDLEPFEDHLFTFPEDDHYELAIRPERYVERG
jgi:hypothetical protein